MADYANPEYWDERYKKESDPFEWYQDFKGCSEVLKPLIQKNCHALVSGCGNSELSMDLLRAGAKSVMSVDVSEVVVQQMNEKYKDHPELKFSSQDVCRLAQPAAHFELIVDKATFDTLLCGKNAEQSAAAALTEYSRVLKTGGYCVIISYAPPEMRQHYFKHASYGWNIKPAIPIAKPSVSLDEGGESESADIDLDGGYHYVYILHKNWLMGRCEPCYRGKVSSFKQK